MSEINQPEFCRAFHNFEKQKNGERPGYDLLREELFFRGIWFMRGFEITAFWEWWSRKHDSEWLEITPKAVGAAVRALKAEFNPGLATPGHWNDGTHPDVPVEMSRVMKRNLGL